VPTKLTKEKLKISKPTTKTTKAKAKITAQVIRQSNRLTSRR